MLSALFIFMLDTQNNLPCPLNLHIETDGTATDLAVFDIVLLGNRAVNQDFDDFPAIGAVHVT
jgi:hypothetical protein